jgi:multiple sugar transport system ATP-binding protein
VNRAANIVGLRHQLDRTPVHLSGGRRQLVAMGRAIVRQPAVFPFDEPLSNTHAKLRDAVPSEIAALHKRAGTTVIYMTHAQVDAFKVASLTIAIDRAAARTSAVRATCMRDVYARPAARRRSSSA